MLANLTAVAAHVTPFADHPWGPPFGGFWPIFPLTWLLVWAAVITTIVLVLRRRGRAFGAATATRTAESVLADRYARGEIDDEEYRRRLEILRAKPEK
ncbi:SHOCT domain-containing protein [Fodinicola acaciae]|uniref:SHOCT domain-containing protein n=1 Tax=Fodinicola acaciae TaxID=2681555 RepID=UPI0013D5F3EF|nr:SHOCT domain-containing protein [Fodinicola acaciae]